MITTSTIQVHQIHCDGCENTIRTALGKIAGVRDVRPDSASKTVRLTYDEQKTTETELRDKLTQIGFDPVA